MMLVIQNVTEMLVNELEKRKSELTNKYKTRILIILHNLLRNAIKYTQKGFVKVKVHKACCPDEIYKISV